MDGVMKGWADGGFSSFMSADSTTSKSYMNFDQYTVQLNNCFNPFDD